MYEVVRDNLETLYGAIGVRIPKHARTGSSKSMSAGFNDGQDGPFRLEVDWIAAYRESEPFSMDALRWEKRSLLLVVGPDERDPRLRDQLAAVEATRDAFDESDMVLIVFLGDGPSHGGERPLTKDEGRGRFPARAIRGREGTVPIP